jgi:hypothetical protein
MEVDDLRTRAQIYCNEATDLLRNIAMYKTLTEEQVYRFYPGKEVIIKNLLTHLTKQGRIYRNLEDKRYSANAGCDSKIDTGLLAAVWVLIDLKDKVEYHYASDFPVKIAFFADGEVYEIICVPYEQEVLISRALAGNDESGARRIILVDCPEQINAIDIPNATGFCSVDSNGSVRYYKLE